MTRLGRLLAGVVLALVATAAIAAEARIGFLSLDGDPRYDEAFVYARIELRPTGNALEGARLGIADSAMLADATGNSFVLDPQSAPDIAGLAMLQAFAFLRLAALFGYGLPAVGYLYVIPAIVMAGLMLGSIGLVVSVYTPQIENFAGMMNLVVFPMFFLSSALYPLWKLREAGADPVYYWLSAVNPFTHAVELMRYAAYGKLGLVSLGVVAGCALLAFLLAARGYDPQAGAIRKVKRD